MGGSISKISGRRGAVIADDPWQGSVMDCGAKPEWVPVKPVPEADGWRPRGVPTALQVCVIGCINTFDSQSYDALQVPYARVGGRMARRLPVKAVEVTPLSQLPDGTKRWAYRFSRMIVGHAAVALDAVSTGAGAGGNLTLRHCELLNETLGEREVFCLALAHLPDQPDTYMLPAGVNRTANTDDATSVHLQLAAGAVTTSASGRRQLTPAFTWHGFQFVVVEATQGVSFAGTLDSLEPRWTVPELTETSAISFAGEGAKTLEQIQEITVASQISNLAGYGPSDCPTREKHWWLGDAQDTAEEAMYNFFTPGVHELFVHEMRASQVINASNEYRGFIRGVVPAVTNGPPQKGPAADPFPGDISWTAAYPLTVSWLHKYYGDVHIIEEHWLTLKAYVDAQRRQMLPSDGVPCFYMWGDWCTPFEARSNATEGTGPPSSAANYIMAIDAMVTMADAIGQTADAARYSQELTQWRVAYDARFFDQSTGTYTSNPLEVQTITATALAAKAVPAARLSSAVRALATDVSSRGFHLSVGSVGQKWLLNELTANGHHDSALKVAMQTTYPSWGHWLALGATSALPQHMLLRRLLLLLLVTCTLES
jgi:hypothetical protein